MGLTVTVTPGKQFASTEAVDIPKLNQLGQPTFLVTGTVGTSEMVDSSVTAAKTVPDKHFYTASVSFAAGIYTLTYSPMPTAGDGLVVVFKANAPNTGATQITLGASTKKLFRWQTETLRAGDIVTNQIVEARYDSGGDSGAGAWQMLSPVARQDSYYTASVTGTNAYAATLTPPAAASLTLADIEGVVLRLKVPNTNTGAVTLNVTIGGVALGAKSVYRPGGSVELTGGDWQAGQIVEVVYTTAGSGYFIHLGLTSNRAHFTPPGIETARDLEVISKTATPRQAVTVSAGALVLAHLTTGAVLSVQGVSFDCDLLAAQGLNGPDFAGTPPGSVWMYLWVVSNGTNVGGLWSQSSASPTRTGTAAGYDYATRIGVCRNTASGGNLRIFRQTGTDVFGEDVTMTSAASASVAAPLSVVGIVPPIAKSAWGIAASTSAAQGVKVQISYDNSFTVGTASVAAGSNSTAVGGFNSAGHWRIPFRGSGTDIYWRTGDANNVYTIICNGFSL
jgi:hypothetical protein